MVRRREAIMSLARSGAHVSSLLSSVKAGVSHGVGGGPGGGWRRLVVLVTPGQTVSVGPAVSIVALPVLAPPSHPAHLPVLALQSIVAIVVLEGRGTHGPTVVLPLRLSQQLLLQNIVQNPDIILQCAAHMLRCLCSCEERKPPWL